MRIPEMRTVRHCKIITSQIDYVESILTQLTSLADHSKKVIENGKYWLDENAGIKVEFPEMTLGIEKDIANILSKCLDIANSSDSSNVICGKSFLPREVKDLGSEPFSVDVINSNEATALLRIRLEDLVETVSLIQIGIQKQSDDTVETKAQMGQLIASLDCRNKEHENFKTEVLQKLADVEDWMDSARTNSESRVNMEEIQQFQKDHVHIRENVSTLEAKLQELLQKDDNKTDDALVARIRATEETCEKCSSLLEKIDEKCVINDSDRRTLLRKLDSACFNISQLQTTCSELPLSLQKRLDGYDKQINLSNVVLLRRLTSLKEVFDRDLSFRKINAANANVQLTELKIATANLKFDASVFQGKFKNVSDKLKLFIESTDRNVDNLTQRVDSMVSQVSKVESLLQENRRKIDSNIKSLRLKFSDIEDDINKMKGSRNDHSDDDEYSGSGCDDDGPRNSSKLQGATAIQENDSGRPMFSAFFPGRKRWNLFVDDRVSCFHCMKYNIGDYYNPREGVFTAPFHGVYIVSLNFHVQSGGKVQINVLRKGSGPPHQITRTSQPTRFSKACDVVLIELLPGDELFIISAIESRNIVFDESSHFSCFLVFMI